MIDAAMVAWRSARDEGGIQHIDAQNDLYILPFAHKLTLIYV